MSLEEQFWDLLGSWTGVEEQSASPWSPASSARAALTFNLDLGGTAVLQDYRQVREDGGEFFAHGVFLADASGPGRTLWWLFDSVGNPPDPAPGVWDGPSLTLTKTTPRGSALHRFELAPDRLTYAIDLALTGQDPMSFLPGRYERVSGH